VRVPAGAAIASLLNDLAVLVALTAMAVSAYFHDPAVHAFVTGIVGSHQAASEKGLPRDHHPSLPYADDDFAFLSHETDFSRFPTDETLKNAPAVVQRALRANVILSIQERGHRRDSHDELSEISSGSGVILGFMRGKAIVMTNRHVIPGPAGVDGLALRVYSVTGERVLGRVLWTAPKGVDLALVECRFSRPGPAAAPADLSRPTSVGEKVFAIGNPSDLGWTYTEGAVSGLRVRKDGGYSVRFIQTQTPLNPGNSGGGLYDEQGYLLGINTLRGAAGIGFAISLDNLEWLSLPRGIHLLLASDVES
jgi:S1-C subfamily serine protease